MFRPFLSQRKNSGIHYAGRCVGPDHMWSFKKWKSIVSTAIWKPERTVHDLGTITTALHRLHQISQIEPIRTNCVLSKYRRAFRKKKAGSYIDLKDFKVLFCKMCLERVDKVKLMSRIGQIGRIGVFWGFSVWISLGFNPLRSFTKFCEHFPSKCWDRILGQDKTDSLHINSNSVCTKHSKFGSRWIGDALWFSNSVHKQIKLSLYVGK